MDPTASRRSRAYWSLGIGLPVLYLMVRESDWLGTRTLHSAMESVATMLALTVGAMALVRYYTRRKESLFLFVGAGFLGTAFLDGYHTIVTSAFFSSSMPSPPPALIPWSWISSRLFLSIFMMLSWWAWTREQHSTTSHRFNEVMVFSLTAVFTVLSSLFFTFSPLPGAYFCEAVPGGAWSCPILFGRPEEFLPAIFLGVALVGYIRKGHWKHESFEHWLIVSLIVGLVGQAVIMSFARQNFDFEFDVAHTLKTVSYAFVLIGLMVSMFQIFRNEQASADSLSEALQRAKQASAELERSNEELDAFAYVASHDLKEPLRGIHNYSQFLIEDYGDQLDEEGKEKLETLKRLAQRMDGLISTLLRFSRVGRTQLACSETDTGALAQRAVEALRAAVEEDDSQVEISDDLPTIPCDPVLTGQVFQNLIGNAVKYGNGEMTRVEVGCNGGGEDPVFYVRDNGIGIREKDQEAVFRIFKRLHGRNKHGGGLGAGLTIAKKIVERHGGRLWVESTFGEGSTFYFTLSQDN